jgi:hypothetical protein
MKTKSKTEAKGEKVVIESFRNMENKSKPDTTNVFTKPMPPPQPLI